MVKTSYIDISPEMEEEFYKNIQPGDRFTFARVIRKNLLLSRNRKIDLAGRSLFSIIADEWRKLTDEQKIAWGNAADVCDLSNWQLFIQDYAARLANSLSGIATPNLLHQSWVGQIHIESPANEAKIAQLHPRSYYIQQKVVGKKRMYSPILVTEDLGLPFTLGLNYKSNLTASGANPFAKMYATFWYSYQGQNLEHELTLPIDLIADWKSDSIELTALTSYVVRYNIYIHLHDVRGDLFFDHVRAEHSGQNWAKDPFCRDIDKNFSRNFYQVPQSWAGVITSEGVDFESIYKDF